MMNIMPANARLYCNLWKEEPATCLESAQVDGVQTFTDCQDTCSEDENCKYFLFNKGNNTCETSDQTLCTKQDDIEGNTILNSQVRKNINLKLTEAKKIQGLRSVYENPEWEANKTFYFGSSVNWKLLKTRPEDAKLYDKISNQDFNIITAENQQKVNYTYKSENVWKFEKYRLLMNHKQNGQEVRGHALVGQNFVPNWALQNVSDVGKFIKDSIDAQIAEEPNLKFWDVVNEPLIYEPTPPCTPDDWENCIRKGEAAKEELDMTTYRNDSYTRVNKSENWDYIRFAFYHARQTLNSYASDTKLVWNDCHTHSNKSDKWKIQLNAAQNLSEEGVPIDVIAFQMHIDNNVTIKSYNEDELKEIFAQYGTAGFEIHISEFSFASNDVWFQNRSRDEQEQITAEVWASALKVCLDEPKCTTFQSWGFTDRKNWGLNERSNFYYDRAFLPKKTRVALWDVMSNPKSQIDEKWRKFKCLYKSDIECDTNISNYNHGLSINNEKINGKLTPLCTPGKHFTLDSADLFNTTEKIATLMTL